MIGITERGDGFWNFDDWKKRMHLVEGAIIITKTPARLLTKVDEIPDNVIIHCTITGLGGSIIEPGVESPSEAIKAFKQLEERFGDKVILRIDPVFPTRKGMDSAMRVLIEAKPKGRVRTSILDLYNHVLNRMTKDMVKRLKHIYGDNLHAPLPLRRKIIADMEAILGRPVEICGEPGLPCTGCVSEKDLDTLGIKTILLARKGQRSACACIAEKKELLSNRGRCPNKCLYCYWR